MLDNEMQIVCGNDCFFRVCLESCEPFSSAPSQITSLDLFYSCVQIALQRALRFIHTFQQKGNLPTFVDGPTAKHKLVKISIVSKLSDIMQHYVCRNNLSTILETTSKSLENIALMIIHWGIQNDQKSTSSVRVILKPPKSRFFSGFSAHNFTVAIQFVIRVNSIEAHLADRRVICVGAREVESFLLKILSSLLITVMTSQAETNNCVVIKGPTARGADPCLSFGAVCPSNQSTLRMELNPACRQTLFEKITIQRDFFQVPYDFWTDSSLKEDQRKRSVVEVAGGFINQGNSTAESIQWSSLSGFTFMEKFQTLLVKLKQ
eukprot:Sdes_comp20031_c0_seq1m12793